MSRFPPLCAAVLALSAGSAFAQASPAAPRPRADGGSVPLLDGLPSLFGLEAADAPGARGFGVAKAPPARPAPRRTTPGGLPLDVLAAPAYYRGGLDVFAGRVRTSGPTLAHRLSRTGGGVRGYVAFTPNLFVDGEVQYNTIPNGTNSDSFFDSDSDNFQQFRVGLGATAPLGRTGLALGANTPAPPPSAWAKVEFASFSVDPFLTYFNEQDNVSARGVGVHVGGRLPFGPYAALYGQGGYLFLRDFGLTDGRVSGPEYVGGVEVTPVPTPRYTRFKLFTEVRYTGTEFRNNRMPGREDGVAFRTWRAGIRFGFGGGVPGTGER